MVEPTERKGRQGRNGGKSFHQEYSKALGRKVSLFRSYYNLSQADLAKRIGCSQYYISSCECGKSLISTQYLLRFYEEFGISLAYFEPDKIEIAKFFKDSLKNQNEVPAYS